MLLRCLFVLVLTAGTGVHFQALGNLLRGEGGEEAFPLLFAAAMRWLDEGMEGQASSYIEDVFRRVRWSLRAALRSPAVKDIPSLRAALAGPLR